MATSKRPQESEKNSRESKLIPVLDKSNVLSYSRLLVRHKLVSEVCDLCEVLFREIHIPMMPNEGPRHLIKLAHMDHMDLYPVKNKLR